MVLKFDTKTVVVLLLVVVALLSGAELSDQLEIVGSITNLFDSISNLADSLSSE